MTLKMPGFGSQKGWYSSFLLDLNRGSQCAPCQRRQAPRLVEGTDQQLAPQEKSVLM